MSDSLFARYAREFPAGHLLFREGEPGSEMFVIQSGLVQVLKRVGGEDRPLATLGRGDFVGEMAILNGKPRVASALVVEDAQCVVLDGAMLETMVTRSPEIAVRLIKKLASRLDAADELIQILLNPDPKARVMLGIRRQAEAFGIVDSSGVALNQTRADLAHAVGADESDVVDVLQRLGRLHITREENGSIVVLDLSRLLEFMELLEMPQKFEAM
ncbi:MAG: Crp/Fnr family transcriptional regulator [Myxococcales bacterium]